METTGTFGSISHGTHRLEDLIPAFMDALKELDEAAAARLIQEYPLVLTKDGSSIEDYNEFAREEACYLLDRLFDILAEYAPKNGYFGAHPGDGSDFGFWPVETY
ncbi:MAG TPA: hypothetical protein PKA10_12205 [Selenomonadales bacterium]|nr:hypothetical protein [Selenomonadales bacterium]